MKPLSAKKLIKILQKCGFILVRQKGSHMIWKNLQNGTMVPIPIHKGSAPLPIGTFMAIVKQSKISTENFK